MDFLVRAIVPYAIPALIAVALLQAEKRVSEFTLLSLKISLALSLINLFSHVYSQSWQALFR